MDSIERAQSVHDSLALIIHENFYIVAVMEKKSNIRKVPHKHKALFSFHLNQEHNYCGPSFILLHRKHDPRRFCNAQKKGRRLKKLHAFVIVVNIVVDGHELFDYGNRSISNRFLPRSFAMFHLTVEQKLLLAAFTKPLLPNRTLPLASRPFDRLLSGQT